MSWSSRKAASNASSSARCASTVEESIPPGCKSGKIILHDDQGNQEHYSFNFGSVDPLDSEQGVKKRLFNLLRLAVFAGAVAFVLSQIHFSDHVVPGRDGGRITEPGLISLFSRLHAGWIALRPPMPRPAY